LAFKSWRKQHPKLAEWAKTPAAESLTTFDVEGRQQRFVCLGQAAV